MCSLGTNASRLEAQTRFFADYVSPGARVLEIGCATGELAAVARATLPIATYEGIELSPPASARKSTSIAFTIGL